MSTSGEAAERRLIEEEETQETIRALNPSDALMVLMVEDGHSLEEVAAAVHMTKAATKKALLRIAETFKRNRQPLVPVRKRRWSDIVHKP